MVKLIAFMLIAALSTNEQIVFNFDKSENRSAWRIINDSVMGGVSRSSFALNPDTTATFSGTVSPDNFGGFASIRALVKENETTQFDGVKIRVKGDGNIYNIRFRTNNSFDGYSYQAKFKTIKDEWQEYKISFDEFTPNFRGRVLNNKPVLKSEDIRQVGILIADKQFGKFLLHIDWIKFY